jgi:hypothetical protein
VPLVRRLFARLLSVLATASLADVSCAVGAFGRLGGVLPADVAAALLDTSRPLIAAGAGSNKELLQLAWGLARCCATPDPDWISAFEQQTLQR